MYITHFTKHAGLLVVSAAVMVFLQYTAAVAVYAAAPSAVLEQEHAVLTIYDGSAGGGQIVAGKGFFVDKSGVIAVPYEIVSGSIGNPADVLFVRTGEGSYIQVDEVALTDAEHGIALLKADLPDAPVVRLSPGRRVGSQEVFIAGSAGPDRTPASGKIIMLPNGEEAVLTTQLLPPVEAGSPVMKSDGDVVGMLGGKTHDGVTANRLILSSYIADLLNRYRKSRPNPEGRIDSTEDDSPDREELRTELEKAKTLVEQEPGDARALVMLGWAYSRLGMYADAIDAYRNAATIKPASPGIYNNIGVIFGKNMGMFDKAIAEFRRALLLKPDYDEARFNLAVAYAFSDDMESAMKEYRELKKRDPERALKLFHLIYQKQEEEEDGGPDLPGNSRDSSGRPAGDRD